MIRIAVLMDPLATLSVKKDSTLAMIEAAQKRGWPVSVFYPESLALVENKVTACLQRISLQLDVPNQWYTAQDQGRVALDQFDVVLMRLDPPYNMRYQYCTYFLSMAEREGVLVLNPSQALRDCNEKLFATQFPQCCTPLLVSADCTELRGFYEQHEDVIFKPLDGMGGASIFRVKADDPNVSVILETLTEHGTVPIMGQRYIPDIRNGDKRILVVDGEPVEYGLARIPASGETRGNLAAGGRGEVRPLSERDRWIVDQVAPTLKEKGLLFVGLDVIGDYLTEINVTSPTCIREIDRGAGTDIGGVFMLAIERRLNAL